MAKTKQDAKKLRQDYLVGIDGHNHRIKEQRKVIKDAKKAIKMHQLLKKQRRTQYKLEQLEA